MQVIRNFLEKHHITETTFAIGVSGGADSLALALSFKEEYPDYHIIALTVDHGLRPSSHDEAQYVAKLMRQYNIEHHTLVWEGEKPQTGIEEQARLARYKLLCDWCKDNHISHLAIAHHLFDQAETFLMRLQRGSGLYGLSAMDEISERQGVKLLRPFLDTHPDVLKDYLKTKNIDWVEDESNQCADFLRVRMRRFLPILEQETMISPARICEAAADLRRVRCFLEDTVNTIIQENVHNWKNVGYSVDYTEFLSWHSEIRFYVLGRLITSLQQQAYAPEADSLTALVYQLSFDKFSGATLGGCHIFREDLKLWIVKENRKKFSSYAATEWEAYMINNPEVRGLKIPQKLKVALLDKKLSKKI